PAVLAAAGRTDIPVTGAITLNATVGGTTDGPQAQVDVTAGGLEAYHEVLGALTAKAQIANQTVTVSELKLDKPQPDGNGTLEATGTYNLESKDYSANVVSRNLRLISLTLPDGSLVRATL